MGRAAPPATEEEIAMTAPVPPAPTGRHHSGGARRRALARPALVVLAGMLVVALGGCDLPFGPGGSGGSGGTTIPVKVEHGQDHSTLVAVPVYIDGKGPYSFILDTGSSISLIDVVLARQLGLPRSGTRQGVSGVGGTEQIVFVSVGRWKVGSLALPSMSVGSGRLPGDRGGNGMQGLLGSDIWSQFGRIDLDYTASALVVYGQIAARGLPRRGAVRADAPTARRGAPAGAVPVQ
jgi:hypothetical protein